MGGPSLLMGGEGLPSTIICHNWHKGDILSHHYIFCTPFVGSHNILCVSAKISFEWQLHYNCDLFVKLNF